MRTSIITLFLLSSTGLALAQNIVDSAGTALPGLEGLFDPNEVGTRELWNVKAADNEYQLLFSTLFVAYKEFLSSQDNSICNFHPSCSVYAVHSIQEKGAIIGVLSAFDRLLRCNGFNRKDYNINPDNRLLDDPVI